MTHATTLAAVLAAGLVGALGSLSPGWGKVSVGYLYRQCGLTATADGPAIIFGEWYGLYPETRYDVAIAQATSATSFTLKDWSISAVDAANHLAFNDENWDFFAVTSVNGCPAVAYFAVPREEGGAQTLYPDDDELLYCQAKSASPVGPSDWVHLDLHFGADWMILDNVSAGCVAGRPVVSAAGATTAGASEVIGSRVAWAATSAPQSREDWQVYDLSTYVRSYTALQFTELNGRLAAVFAGAPLNAPHDWEHGKAYLAMLDDRPGADAAWGVTLIGESWSDECPAVATSATEVFVAYAAPDGLKLAQAKLNQCQDTAAWKVHPVDSNGYCYNLWLAVIADEPALLYDSERDGRRSGYYFARPRRGQWDGPGDWLKLRVGEPSLHYAPCLVDGKPAFASFVAEPVPQIKYAWADKAQPRSKRDWHSTKAFTKQLGKPGAGQMNQSSVAEQRQRIMLLLAGIVALLAIIQIIAVWRRRFAQRG